MSGLQSLDVTGRQHRRGVVKASFTKLIDLVGELEGKVKLTHSDWLEAERLRQRLTNLDCEFRTYHLGMVDLLQEEGDLENERAALDYHDDRVNGLVRRLAHLVTLEEQAEKPSSFHFGVCKGVVYTWKEIFGRFLTQSLLLQTRVKWIIAYWSSTTSNRTASSWSSTTCREFCLWTAMLPSCRTMRPEFPSRFLTSSYRFGSCSTHLSL